MKDSILQDIVKYNDAGKMMQDCVDRKINLGMDVFVSIGESKPNAVIYAGVISRNANEIVERINKLPKQVRLMPNDTMEIKADVFEREFHLILR